MDEQVVSGVDSITSITPTICKLMGISPPTSSDGNILNTVIQTAEVDLSITNIDKCLIYAPDAIGTIFYREYESYFKSVRKYAPSKVPLLSVFPPKTPVCFASMFTGSLPEIHGIKAYEKPVLTCDTIFDALERAGKSVAIVAVENSSIDRIFRKRSIDYFSEKYDEQVTKCVLDLIQTNKHDFILAYHQEYDDVLHETDPRSQPALQAVRNHVKSFEILATTCEKHWRDYNRLILFAPDHGAHINPVTGKGTHGENIPEDMQVMHFFGFGKGK